MSTLHVKGKTESITRLAPSDKSMESGFIQAIATADLRDAEQILADLNDLSNRLSKAAPNNPAFYAINRAWRAVSEAIRELRKAME